MTTGLCCVSAWPIRGLASLLAAQQRIFEIFEQADITTTKRHGGTGLGLAICRSLVELMGGTIWLKSQPGLGSRFFFTACFELAAADLEIATEATPLCPLPGELTSLSGLSILLADDVEINRELVKAVLAGQDHHFTEATNGREAVDAFTAGRFDIVLMDIQMPVMDGLQATMAIREFERNEGRPRTPVVALTAYAAREDQERCLQAGMDDYLCQTGQAGRHRGGPATPLWRSTGGSAGHAPPPAAQRTGPAQPVPPVYDRAGLLERLGGAEALIPKFMGMFHEGIALSLEGLELAIQAARRRGGPDRRPHHQGVLRQYRRHADAGDG